MAHLHQQDPSHSAQKIFECFAPKDPIPSTLAPPRLKLATTKDTEGQKFWPVTLPTTILIICISSSSPFLAHFDFLRPLSQSILLGSNSWVGRLTTQSYSFLTPLELPPTKFAKTLSPIPKTHTQASWVYKENSPFNPLCKYLDYLSNRSKECLFELSQLPDIFKGSLLPSEM